MSDATDAVALFNDPTVTAGRLALWPTESGLDLNGKETYFADRIGGLIPLGFTADDEAVTVKLAPASLYKTPGGNWTLTPIQGQTPTQRPHQIIPVGSWLRQIIGPRPGLTPPQLTAAYKQAVKRWYEAMIAAFPGPHIAAAVTPPNLPTAVRTRWDGMVITDWTPLAPWECGADERGGTLGWGDVYAAYEKLRLL